MTEGGVIMPSEEDFRIRLEEALNAAARSGAVALEVNSGRLHREIGGYPGANHRMPVCCGVMKSVMQIGDVIVESPPKAGGSS